MPLTTATSTKIIAALFFLVFASSLLAREPPVVDTDNEAVVRADSNLYEVADDNANIIVSLKAGARVEILARKNAWYEVKYSPVLQSGVQGWIPLQSLQLIVGAGFASYFSHILKPAPVSEGALSVYDGEEDSSNDTPVTTIRALSKQNLTNVEPDEEAIRALEKYAVNKEQASNFASQLGLNTHKIEYLVKAEAEKEVSPEQAEAEEDF